MGATTEEQFGISPLNGFAAEAELTEVTFVCADVVRFTAMTQRLGDSASFLLMRRIASRVQAEARSRGGRTVEVRGDSFLLTLPTSGEAIACAEAIHRALRRDSESHADGGVEVRIAIHAGKVLKIRDQFFGLNLILPYRLLSLLRPGETAVSDAIGGAAGERRICQPKGFVDPVAFFVLPGEGVPVAASTFDMKRTRERSAIWPRTARCDRTEASASAHCD